MRNWLGLSARDMKEYVGEEGEYSYSTESNTCDVHTWAREIAPGSFLARCGTCAE